MQPSSNHASAIGVAQKTWLVIPMYNEGEVLRGVLEDAKKTFPNIVCVDDGSSDDSARVAISCGAAVVRHPVNLGQGAALQTGLDYALGQPGAHYFVTFDSDGQHRTDDALEMVTRLATEPLDVVIGSRFLGKGSNFGLLKRFILKAAVIFERLSTGLKLTDAHNGLRAFNRTAAAAIQITQNRMAHASEITAQIGQLSLRYAEHPVRVLYTDYSRSKGQSVWNSVNIVNDLLFK